MKKLLIRTLSGAIYVLIIRATIYSAQLLAPLWPKDELGFPAREPQMLGSLISSAIFLLIGIIGTHEIITNLTKKGVECNRTMAYMTGILTFAIVHLNWTSYFYYNLFWTGNYMYLLPALWLSVFLVQLWRMEENPFATVGYTLLPSIWLMMPLALMTTQQYCRPWFLMMLFIFIWVNDTFAYLTGMLLGKHKMWERHSPNKTWEGTIGGVLFTLAAAVFIAPLFESNCDEFFRWNWVVVALICSIVGTLGDLVESMFKRYCGVKDSGNIMPGHGGVLDRFDSILLAVPFVEVYLVILYS